MKRRLFKNIKYIVLFILFMIMLSTKTYALPQSSINYKIYTDGDGVRWRYAYNDDTTSTGESPSKRWVEISFYDKPANVTKLVVPSLTELKKYDYSIPSKANIIKLVGYSYQSFNNNISEISLENVNEISSVYPMVSSSNETKIIFSNTNETVIGNYVFQGYKLELVNTNKISEIGEWAFSYTTLKNSKTSLTNLKKIGDSAFYGSSIASVEINVDTIEYNAFRNCKNLVEVKIGDAVTNIKASAFDGDSSLASFNFNNVKTIGNYAFRDCKSFNTDISNTKLTSIGDGAFWGTTSYDKDITIPRNVTYIGYKTFAQSNIKSVRLNNVKTVDTQAFEDCKNLTSINFGKVERINYRAFAGNTKLKNVTFTDSVYDIGTQAFMDCSIETLNLNKVERIADSAFRNNKLTELYLPKSINVLNESNMFSGNDITKVIVAYDTMSTGMGNLFRIVFGDYNVHDYEKIKELELIAPYGKNESVVINSKVGSSRSTYYSYSNDSTFLNLNEYKNYVKDNYFFGMSGLEKIKIGEGYEFLGAQSFFTDRTISYTRELIDGLTDEQKKYYKLKKVELPSTLKGIGGMAFAYNLMNDDVEINFPEGLEYIGYQAFMHCKGLKNDIDLKNLRILREYAFQYSNISSIHFYDKLEYFGSNSIFLTRNLKNIIFDVDFFSLATNYSYSNSKLTYSYNGNGNIFAPICDQYNSSNTNQCIHTVYPNYDTIKFTDKVSTYPANSTTYWGFMFKMNAKTVDMEDSNWKVITPTMFQEANIGTLKLPNDIQSIQSNSFFKTTIKNELILPDTLKVIGNNSFQESKLKINKIPENVERIEQAAFLNTDFNSNPVIPKSVKYIGPSAFAASDGYEKITRESITFDCDLAEGVVDAWNKQYASINAMTYNTSTKKLILTENVKHLPSNTIDNEYLSEFFKMDMEEVIIEGLEVIPSRAFQENASLKVVDLSKDKNLKEIESFAFFNDEELETIKLPDDKNQEVKLGYSTFRNTGLTSIGSDNNSGLNLNSVKFVLKDEKLGDTFVFAENKKLKEVNIPNGFNNNYIPKFTFTRNPYLEKATIGENIEKIGEYAFAEDVNLEKIFIWGNTKIERINKLVDINKAGEITVIDKTNSLNYDFIIKKDGEEVSSMSVNTKTKQSNELKYNYDGTGEITFEYPETVMINSKETDDGYEVTVRTISPDNFTIPSTTDIYAYSNSDASKYDKDYSKYRRSNTLDTNGEILYLDEVLYLTANYKSFNKNLTKDNFDKSKLTAYALRRDGVVMESSSWGKLTNVYKLEDSKKVTFSNYDKETKNKREIVYPTPLSIDKVDTSTENFENMTYDMVNSGNSNKLYLYYTNTFTDNQVSAPITVKSPIEDVLTWDNILKYFIIFILSGGLLIFIYIKFKRKKCEC